MKILFVTLTALEVNTSVTKSNYGLIRGFAELGHDITIIMPDVNRQAYYYDNSFDISKYNVIRLPIGKGISQTLADSNMKARNRGAFMKKMFKTIRSVYKYFSLFERSTRLYVRQVPNLNFKNDYYDLVISTSDPKSSHLFTRKIIETGLKYGKWVQHWGDPLYGDISKKNIYPKFVLKKVENFLYEKADEIVFVSPFTAEQQRSRHKRYINKIHFSPLICDLEKLDGNDYVYKKNGILNVAYLGDYNSKVRNIMPLYEACRELPFVKLTIAGHSDIKLLQDDNISVYGRLKNREASTIESQSDVVVSIANLRGTQIPGKIYYMASSKKIIITTVERDNKDAMIKYLESYQRFEICLNTKESIKALLLSLYNTERSEVSTPQQLKASFVVKEMLSRL